MKLKSIASNMTELHFSSYVVLFSYETPVAAYVAGEGYYRTSAKYSATTTRHINKWLDGVKAEEKTQEFFDALAGE